MLPNKYGIVRCSKYLYTIVNFQTNEKEIVAAGGVCSYAVVDNIVLGYITQPYSHTADDDPEGYFLLDTRKNNIEKGLTLDELDELLEKKYNIKDCPAMTKIFSIDEMNNDQKKINSEKKLAQDIEIKGKKHTMQKLRNIGEKRTLPNNYSLIKDQYGCWEITNKEKDVIMIIAGPSVTSYAVVGDYVLGQCADSSEIPKGFSDESGYFILNTKTGYIEKGMEKEEAIAKISSEAKEFASVEFVVLEQ